MDSWDSQKQQIEFGLTEGGNWILNITSFQDSESGLITNFEAIIGEGEIPVVTGSFVYTSEYEDIPRSITFRWNQMAQLCEFNNIGLASEHFTTEEGENFYETIVYEREED